MVDERLRLIEESNGLGTALDPLYDKPADQTRKKERSADLAARQSFLTRQIQQARQMQVSLTYAYPALSAIWGETGDNPQDIQQVQERLPGEFDGIRSNIDRLRSELAQDPSTALLFDSVVATQLQDKSLTPQQQQQLTDWLKSERAGKEQAQQLGGLASGGLFMASFVPQLKGISLGLRLLGIGSGAAVVASELPDLIWLDAAAQAGRGGEGQLTSQSPEQARFNLVMGYANLGLAGLDIGMEVGAVQRLARIPGVVSAVGALTREQGRVLMMSLGRLKSDVSDAVVQKMAQAVKGADELTAMTIVNADGTLTQSRPLGKVADNMQATVAARSSGKAKKPPKAFDEYANALTVKPFIGSKVDPNNLPEGYLYGKIPLGENKFREVIYMPESSGDMVPLKVDAKGFIKEGTEGEYRIVNKNTYDKNIQTVPGKSGKLLGGDSQVHHLFPDNIIRELEVTQEALKRGIYNPDRTSNLLEMANKSVSDDTLRAVRQANPNAQLPDIRHYSSHAEYDGEVRRLIDEAVSGRDVRQLSDREILQILDNTETELRGGFLGTNKKNQRDLPVNDDNRLVHIENHSEEEFA